MDILKPELVWIEGRCYRKLPIRQTNRTEAAEERSYPSKNRYLEENLNDNELPIKHEGDRFFITISVPGPLIGYVVGKKGAVKKSIEEQTSTKIKIPSKERPEMDIAIVGGNTRDVAKAYRKVENISNEARWRENYTHFISIPMNYKTIQEGYLKFKEDVLSNLRSVSGITEQLFQPPVRMHLTIAMLTLLNSRDKEAAAALLQKCKNDIQNLLGGKPFRVEIKGIEYMNDDPAEVTVLYGKVREPDSDNCLQIISDNLADEFAKVNLSRKESDHVKLHVTLMKSRGKNGEERGTFDARKILEKYGDYNFGQMPISEIHISVRYAGALNTYYMSSFVLQL